MPFQIVQRAFRGGDHLDAEALEQGAGAELGTLQAIGDLIVGLVCRFGRQALCHAEHVLESVIQPHARRSGAEQVIVRGKDAPDLAAVRLRPAAVSARHAEAFQLDALRAEHAEDVVIRGDEELGRVRKGIVFCKPARVRMTMRADDRQILHAFVKAARNAADTGFNGEQSVRIQQRHACSPPEE